ncbi:MAG: 16S rRNA (cytosine(1402)-N(4))-methyltransferase RsmH [Legionellaceae bacterium]|nr:16S rRNA (cytosine(1402)-N(4))-methyltransferase RsmH [Legionellaceae bacterium]
MNTHKPVLLQEVIHGLAIVPDGVYVDCTFGRGGHSRAILNELNQQGRLIAIDKDLDALAHAKEHFADDPRFQIAHGSFTSLSDVAKDIGVYGRINGILMDLGVSSPQLDDPERGFSFMQQGPLDMRMDLSQNLDAAGFVNYADEADMIRVFREYGEERFAGRIARAIIAARAIDPILTTNALAEIVKQANPKWEKHKHPATRVFQAIRIHVNQELSDLTTCLTQCLNALAVGGRLAVISFHSLEDRIVKQFMRKQERGEQPPLGVPIKAVDIQSCFRCVGKAIQPQEEEIKQNVRSRSAILRIGEKIK